MHEASKFLVGGCNSFIFFWFPGTLGNTKIARAENEVQRMFSVMIEKCSLGWAATNGKVPTEDMLKRRNFQLASRCPMCFKRNRRLTTFLSIVGGFLICGICHYH